MISSQLNLAIINQLPSSPSTSLLTGLLAQIELRYQGLKLNRNGTMTITYNLAAIPDYGVQFSFRSLTRMFPYHS